MLGSYPFAQGMQGQAGGPPNNMNGLNLNMNMNPQAASAGMPQMGGPGLSMNALQAQALLNSHRRTPSGGALGMQGMGMQGMGMQGMSGGVGGPGQINREVIQSFMQRNQQQNQGHGQDGMAG